MGSEMCIRDRLYTAMNEAKNRFDREADKMLDRLVEEFDND